MLNRQSRKLPGIVGYKLYFFTILQICLALYTNHERLHTRIHKLTMNIELAWQFVSISDFGSKLCDCCLFPSRA